MVGKKVKLRIIFLSTLIIILILSTFLILKSLEEEIVYFISPTEIKSLAELDKKKSELVEWLKRVLLKQVQTILIL